jgi:hypothetical protein
MAHRIVDSAGDFLPTDTPKSFPMRFSGLGLPIAHLDRRRARWPSWHALGQYFIDDGAADAACDA